MEALSPATPYTPKSTNPNPQTPTQSPSPLAASSARLWRPTAQRNLRNQWSKLASLRQQWESASSSGRAYATLLVNSYLSIKYMPSRELGVLSDMPDILKKASQKLLKQQELHRSKLLSSYKDMVSVVTNMVKTSRSMRCFVKGSSNSPLLQFSGYSECNNDPGDGGGIPVFTFWSISCFEKVAEELVHMLILELNLKRLLVVDLLSVSCKVPTANSLHWSEELYPGEFGDLSMCNLLSEETCKPVYPRLNGQKSDKPTIRRNHQQPDHDVLQVYLTTWRIEVNIDTHRVDEIFAEVGEEIHCRLS
ncbi:hypothetical protein RchiOBHm_Chr7g0182771 [Rosa chinensis]|uniref:Uncharacterized protein n=1 Tax=Rosa chinensis TaxID=74649 RepID=A0A2P6P321_ROSCH|nr:uncharacterized protein LOC112179333 isoform X1 [Rosa chinensis]PRQ16305.1 hypothetical protein RchiOBHm_Chr7g0182771 [Rosa chinensis]